MSIKSAVWVWLVWLLHSYSHNPRFWPLVVHAVRVFEAYVTVELLQAVSNFVVLQFGENHWFVCLEDWLIRHSGSTCMFI